MNLHVLLLFISVLAWSEINLCTATGEAEATVSFTQASYTVTEPLGEGGEAVSVCVTVTPALVGEAMVMVELIRSEGFSQNCNFDSIVLDLLIFTSLYSQLAVCTLASIPGRTEALCLHSKVASIPGRVFAFITVRQFVCLTVIKAKTRPGIEAA